MPCFFSMSVMEINLFIATTLASYLPKGSISLIYFANRFIEAMNSDLNTPAALAAVFDGMSWSRKISETINHQPSTINQSHQPTDLMKFVNIIRATFGCFEPDTREGEADIPSEVKKLVDERAQARELKDFAASDRLRDAIRANGFEVRDSDGGQEIRRM